MFLTLNIMHFMWLQTIYVHIEKYHYQVLFQVWSKYTSLCNVLSMPISVAHFINLILQNSTNRILERPLDLLADNFWRMHMMHSKLSHVSIIQQIQMYNSINYITVSTVYYWYKFNWNYSIIQFQDLFNQDLVEILFCELKYYSIDMCPTVLAYISISWST